MQKLRKNRTINKQSILTKWFFYKYGLVKPDAKVAYEEALRNQYLPPEELESLNWNRTRTLLRYAYEHVPYYRDKLKNFGLHPSDIKEPVDFQQVPVLSRDDIKENFDKMVSLEARPKDLKLSTTGGSTGEPLKVYHQKKVVRSAMLWRVLDWWDLRPEVNLASIYRDLTPDWKSKIPYTMFWWPTKRILLDASNINENSIKAFLLKYKKYKPPLIHAYVGALDHIADYVLENKIELPQPKAIWVTCSPITLTQERKIQNAFKAPVYDQYGCSEVYWLSAQCPEKKSLHIFNDVVRIEFLDNHNKSVPTGNYGNIAITDLQNKFFPLIRYLNGDRGRAIPGQCTCGLTLPLMDKVKGRISDNIRLPNGTTIAGEYLTTIFDCEPEAIHRFQLIQRRDYSIDILVIQNTDYPKHEQIIQQIKNSLSQKIHNSVPVTIKYVSSIPSHKGKLYFIKSELEK